MKTFEVKLEYDAYRYVTVEAENEEEAFEKARRTDYESLEDFDSIDLNPDYYEALEVEPKTSHDEIVVEDYYCPDGIEEYRDSMQLDSNQELLSISGTVGDYTFENRVVVCGSVRVIFRDEIFKSASRMPKELLECYATGKDPEEVTVSDGKEYETPYFADDTNWFEEQPRVFDKNGDVVFEDYIVIDAPGGNTREGWKNYLLETIRTALKELQEK